jgi:hypothetical protein
MPSSTLLTRRTALCSALGGAAALHLAAPLSGAEPEKPTAPRFVAVGYGLRRLVSDDGMTWRNDTAEADEAKWKDKNFLLRGVTFGKGVIVAVGGSSTSRILVSADGKEWKDHSVQHNFLGDVAFGNELFVAVGYQRALVSKSGTEWGTPIALRDASWRRIEFGNGRFVATGLPSSTDPESGCVATTTDGAKWTSKIVPDKAVPHDIAFGNGRFVIVGSRGLRESSRDGTTWENRTLGEKGELLQSVIWTGKEFLAAGNRGAYASADGLKWEKSAVRLPSRSCFGGGVFVGCSAGRFTYSADGKAWKHAKADGTLQITKIIPIASS